MSTERQSGAVALKEIGGFELIAKIGAGGMGAVFKARQKSLDRIVALKILPPSIAKDQKFIERFLREARTSAKLNHHNIVQGIDAGHDEKSGLYFFAMEFIDGASLGSVLKQEKVLPEKRALEIAREVASALTCAQRAGIVHRDIKPDNILLAADGRVKLADLGLARQTDNSDAGITMGGQALGTPFYMPPEQVRGATDLISIRSDIYALGATLFHLVVGHPPFMGATNAAVMAAHLNEPAPLAHELKPEISEPCSRLIARMLQKDPAKRPQSPEELIEDIDRALAGEFTPAAHQAPRNRTGKRDPVTGRTGKRDPVKGGAGRQNPVAGQSDAASASKQKSPALLLVGIVAVIGVIGAVVALSSGKHEDAAVPGKPDAPPPPKIADAQPPKIPDAPPKADPRPALAADALARTLKENETEPKEAFESVRRLQAIQAAVKGTPSEAEWTNAAKSAEQNAVKIISEQKDYKALLALKEKCEEPPLAAVFEETRKAYEAKALAEWTAAQQEADKKAQSGDFAAAREALGSFAVSTVPAVAESARKDLDRVAGLEKDKNEHEQKSAQDSKTQSERLRYELLSELIKATESLDLTAARKTLNAWSSKPESKPLAAEIAALNAELKWLEEQGAKACEDLAAKKATIDVVLGKNLIEKGAVTAATHDGISVKLKGGAEATVPTGKIAVAEIMTVLGWSQPGKEDLNGARFLFWRNQVPAAQKRLANPASDEEKRVAERIELVLNGSELFYKPQPPKNVAAAIPKDKLDNGKAPEGVKTVPIDLSWESGSLNTRKFRVTRIIGAGKAETVLEAARDVTKFHDDALPLESQVTYNIVALNAAGESPPSAAVNVATPAPKIVNLLTNGDFEDGSLKGWAVLDGGKGTVSYTSEGAHSGKGAMIIRGSGGTDCIVSVEPGKKYQASGWIKITARGQDADPGGGGGVYFFIQSFEYKQLVATPSYVIAGNDPGKKKIAAGEWMQFKVNFTPPGNQIRYRTNKWTDDKYDAMFDDFVLSEAP